MSNSLLSHAAFTIFSGGAHTGTVAHSPSFKILISRSHNEIGWTILEHK